MVKSSLLTRESIKLGCGINDINLDFAGPATHGSAVFAYEGWLAGFQPMTW